MILFAAEAASEQAASLDLNALLSGGGGATLVALIIWVGKLVLDRTIPSRSDSRASQSLVLESLSNLVSVLQEEKTADAARLEAKQDRIETLEASATTDYDTITELRNEITDLRNRLAIKDRHIRILVMELRRLGAQVTGLDTDANAVEDIEVTMDTSTVRSLQPGSDA